MKNSYPKIFFPNEIINIEKSNPSQFKKPEIPELPEKQEFKKPEELLEEPDGCVINAFVGMAISGIGILLFQNGLEIGGLLVPVGGVVIIYYMVAGNFIKEKKVKKRNQYLNDLQDYQNKTQIAEAEYRTNLNQYNFKTKNYQIDCENVEIKNLELLSDNYIISFRYEKLKLLFEKTKKPKQLREINDKSITHVFFKYYLTEQFPNKIYNNVYLEDSKYENIIYIPDYLYFDKELNLYLDIEIDEPYIGNDGTPIHFIKGNDEERDAFFKRNNWLVIRFAESQIIENPLVCCELISDLVQNLKNCVIENSYFQSKIKTVASWTYEEAHKLAFAKYRNKYLLFEMQLNIDDERLENDRNNLKPIYKDTDELPF